MGCLCVKRPRWTAMPWPAKASPAFLMADISSHNPAFNAAAYSSAGHLAIAIKATQGTNYINPSFGAWCVAAHRHRLAVVHYHFLDGLSTGVSEARWFWSEVRPHFTGGLDRLVVDFEEPALGTLAAYGPAYLQEFDRELHRLSGISCEGYTFKSALTARLRLNSGAWWVAAYGDQWPAGALRKLPNGTLWGWQFTDGQIGARGPRAAAGIGHCDLSVLNPAIVRALRKALHR